MPTRLRWGSREGGASSGQKRPLWVKLMPLVTDIGLIARTAADAGVDALDGGEYLSGDGDRFSER